MRRVLIILVALLILPVTALAQTVISVDIAKAKLSWTPGVGGGAVAEYRVKCGSATGVYTTVKAVLPPATSVGVSVVVSAPGTYFCVVTAANQFGESGPSNEVNFTAGNVPSGPTNLLIQAQ